ncbi:MAG: sulfite exporter TauE/SafE family protein [Nitrospirae bacterium]|uniref:Probable membrane transporter protein n=2 Tax=Nitrospirota TaxID=40117 RepID=A0A142BU24_9BACT|nr:sulfite exporter TauE/SafE family protein [Candidatus Magnetobacterium casensis]AIM41310.1 magnetosome protein MamO-Cter [Candidatus Magnetobacterium casensis]AMP41612.1 magnetosome protein MamO-Cter [uncultured Nitrospirota bacterium]MBF0337244.1 sulfite exporter TauE/SafE family protein [Nitrospirota bacterium]
MLMKSIQQTTQKVIRQAVWEMKTQNPLLLLLILGGICCIAWLMFDVTSTTTMSANPPVITVDPDVAADMVMLETTPMIGVGQTLHEPIDGFFEIVLLLVVGVSIGFIGTLIGAGGGFLVVPVLIIFYKFLPHYAVGTSMIIVFLNALSGTFAYVSQRRIDYEIGIKYSVVAIPGVIIGAVLALNISINTFYAIFAMLLTVMAYVLIFVNDFCLVREKVDDLPLRRTLRDSFGTTYVYSPDMAIGFSGSFIVGIISGLLGLGGGIIHVPFMNFIGMPLHVATATSHFIIVITSFFGLVTFLGLGAVNVDYAVVLGIGSILGAYYGARASIKTHSEMLKKIIAVLLVLLSIKLFLNIT